MSNFAKSQGHYLRRLSPNGKTRSLTIPTAILRASSFSDTEDIVARLIDPQTIIIQTLQGWFDTRERQGKPFDPEALHE